MMWFKLFDDDDLLHHQAAVGRNWPTVAFIKQELSKGDPDLHAVSEAWYELPQDEQRLIWKAPSRGGCFTTEERKVIKDGLPANYDNETDKRTA